jgi:hypothetical protein
MGKRIDLPPAAAAEKRAKDDRTVAFVNERLASAERELAEIGRYLLREYFDDSAELVSDRNPEKLNSLRDLAKRKDLNASYVTLWRCVRLAARDRQLGTVSPAKQLPEAHRIELLSVPEIRVVRELSRLAMKRKWTRDELRDEIPKRAGGGRPKPRDGVGEKRGNVVAMVEMSLRFLAGPKAAEALSAERLGALGAGRAARLAPLVDAAIEALRAAKRALAARAA